MPEGRLGEAIIKKYFHSEEWEQFFKSETAEIKVISEYCGLNFKEVLDLQYSDYLLYRKDSWLYNLKQNEQGREFLETLWRLQQTKADYQAIKNFKQGGEK
ncbi:hypothetical protein FDA77_00850 [Clostridium botulinum]|nr:hypothetical protein [Clostridium botulinum]NFJ88497.1 hypothetical protein [Clostridium botulinum]